MPKITVPISNTYESITRPIVVNMAKEVMRICMIDMNTPVYLPGERGVTNQPGTDNNRDEVRFESEKRLECFAEEALRNDSLLATPVRRNEYTPVLFDESLEFSIRPVYLQTDVTLRFKYVANSWNEAKRWKDEMALRIAESRSALQHTLLYDLTLSDNITGLVLDIYTLRERIAGYGDTFPEYFKKISVREFHVKGAVDGDKDKLAIQVSERQAHIAGYFEAGDVPTEQKVDNNVTYEIEFTYKFSYMKPVNWYIQYPLVVHQSHIPENRVDITPRFSIDDLDISHSSRTWNALERIRWRSAGKSPQPIGGLRYPYYDEWFVPNDNVPWSIPVMTWLLSLEPYDPTYILDLKDLPDMEFTEPMVAFLKADHANLNKRCKSMARITLYSNNVPLDNSLYYIDENLVIRSYAPLSMRSTYRARFSLVTSITSIDQEVFDVLSDHAVATLEMLQTIIPNLDVEWAYRHAMDDSGRLNKVYIEWAMTYAEKRGIGANGAKSTTTLLRNNFPLVTPSLEIKPGHLPTGVVSSTPPRDPGLTAGSNSSQEEQVVDFFVEGVHEDPPEVISTIEDDSPFVRPSDSGLMPLINNRRAMLTTQYMAIFTHRR